MIHILYASHTPALKGSAVSLTQLVMGLDRTRYRPVVAFSKKGYLSEQLAREGVSTHILTSKGLLGWRLIRDARHVLKGQRIQLVHLNSAVPFCKYIGMAAKLQGLPVVWHIREDPSGSRVRRLKKWIRRLADRIFVVSSELEEAFRGDGRVVKIYNGVNVERFKPGIDGTDFRRRYDVPRKAFVFGVVGTIENRKGTLAFLDAARQLLNEGRDAYFLVVGDGLSHDERRAHELVRGDAKLAERVTLTGRLANIPEVMAALDVVVIPSLWEGFPRSLIEAMACGKPAIATDVGEIPWMLEDGQTGFLIPRGDQEALVETMGAVMDQRSRLAEMGRLAREKARVEFTIEAHVRAVLTQYRELLPDVIPSCDCSR